MWWLMVQLTSNDRKDVWSASRQEQRDHILITENQDTWSDMYVSPLWMDFLFIFLSFFCYITKMFCCFSGRHVKPGHILWKQDVWSPWRRRRGFLSNVSAACCVEQSKCCSVYLERVLLSVLVGFYLWTCFGLEVLSQLNSTVCPLKYLAVELLHKDPWDPASSPSKFKNSMFAPSSSKEGANFFTANLSSPHPLTVGGMHPSELQQSWKHLSPCPDSLSKWGSVALRIATAISRSWPTSSHIMAWRTLPVKLQLLQSWFLHWIRR